MRKFIVVPFLLALLVGVVSMGQGETIVTIATPGWMSDLFNDELFEDFETETGAKVVFVPIEDVYFPPPSFQLEEHLDGVQEYATRADVLFTPQQTVSPEAVTAGYFLDMMPLVQGDSSLDVNDYYTAMWESFQWDGGMWALPVSGDVQFMVYDRIAFDNAGLAYPNENWTFDDLANAARTLTTYDSNGDVEVPGFVGGSIPLLYHALTGNVFYDETQFPAAPQINQPEFVAFYEEYQALMDEIMPEQRSGPGSFDYYQRVPMIIEGPWRLIDDQFGGGGEDSVERDWQAALLPGGTGGLNVTGFAISGGTANPTLAYELITYLVDQPEVVNRIFGTTPARRSMVGAESDDEQVFFGPEIPPEVQPIIDDAVENAVPYSELRYADYVFGGPADDEAETGGEPQEIDIAEQVERGQQAAEEALQAALDRRDNNVVFVSTPVPTPVLAEGEIVLRFGVNAFSSQIPNRELWDEVVNEFVANHPTVGNIDLTPPTFTGGNEQPTYDCEYQGQSPLQFEQFNVEENYLNLDPFMDSDPNFDPNDFVTGTLDQVQRNNMTWAYPIILQPDVMWYNSNRFQEAGLPEPVGGWTIEAFTDALNMLQATQDAEETFPPFQPQTFNANYIFMLAAAFGGMPYDFSTTPPTLNLTDPVNVNALQQALDLAVNELIGYQELRSFDNSSGGGGVFFGGGSGDAGPAITAEAFTPNSFRIRERQNNDVDNWRLTNYPSGSEYAPVAFETGVALISRESIDPMACYDWIATVAQHPELFNGVPTRRSLVNDPAIAATQGEDIAAMYQEFINQLDQPNVVVLPGSFGGGIGGGGIGAWLEPNWVNAAFNGYVLDGEDLGPLLADAESKIIGYRDCTSDIPEIEFNEETTEEESRNYTRQFVECAMAVDPDVTQEDFPWLYEEQ